MNSGFEIFLEILKYTLPSVVVAVIAYIILNKLLEDNQNARNFELRKENNKLVTPVKLQAYERLVLLLERISPPKLIQEYNAANISALELKNTLIIAVQTEFSHNISQQIYVSNQAWTITKLVKEEVLSFINKTYAGLEKESSGVEFSQAMINIMINTNTQPTQKAIDFLKSEIRIYF